MRVPAQMKIALASVICLVFLAIYVPWTHTLHATGEYGRHVEQPAGYALIFYPPEPRNLAWGVKVDVSRVLIPMAVVVCATIGGFVLAAEKTRKLS